MKKLIVLLLALLPIGAFSQEVKIAFVDFNAIFDVIPEREEAEMQFAAISAQYQEQFNTLQTEYQAKAEEYMKLQDTLTENLKLRRQQEIQDLTSRIENFAQQAEQDLQQEQAKLLEPIQLKIMNAITAVSEEQGYAYILDARALFHTGKNAIDATPLVKTKLGIR